ncbi:MAG: class I SAM-dependent methyltransferase [Gammaproteobacteria bacterium]
MEPPRGERDLQHPRPRFLIPATPVAGTIACMDAREKWDQRYRSAESTEPTPPEVLVDYGHLLPERGIALDLACGRGGAALYLARRGLETQAWDISPVVLEQLDARARALELPLGTLARDVEAHPPEPEGFDVIVVSHFLHRPGAPALSAALRPGGLLFYQTFSRERVSERGPSNPAYRLAPNELLTLFPDLLLRAYREDGTLGNIGEGLRDLALLVAQKPG